MRESRKSRDQRWTEKRRAKTRTTIETVAGRIEADEQHPQQREQVEDLGERIRELPQESTEIPEDAEY